jgi:hypothetical protein
MREEFNLLIKFCCTRPDSYRDVPAAETKSVGLQADARVVMPARPNSLSLEQVLDRSFGRGFCKQPRQFYRDGTTRCRLSGLSHLDNFIVTRKSCPLTGTLPARLTSVGRAKTHANPDTDGNSLYHRAVRRNGIHSK